jgi:NAD(P)-dependent dehydrogenase (short-subunit alcohol dehydrogenase family)
MAEGPLRGKVAIVTGAGSPIGIGHAITLGFVRAGARVAMLDLNQAWVRAERARGEGHRRRGLRAGHRG